MAALLDEPARRHGRLLVVFDARYDPRIFPIVPTTTATCTGPTPAVPPLYYAVNATLGGVPDRIGAVALNNFETYLFLDRPMRGHHAVAVGNLSRFVAGRRRGGELLRRGSPRGDRAPGAEGPHRRSQLEPERDGHRLPPGRAESALPDGQLRGGPARGRRARLLFDHLFTYFK